jgi:hypothetical protein
VEELGDLQEAGGRAVRDGQETVACGIGFGHGADVQVGDVADVDDSEACAGRDSHRAVEHHLDQLGRGTQLGGERRSEDPGRIDDHEFGGGVAHQVPGGALGDRLRAWVRRESRRIRIGPVLLRELGPDLRRVSDRGERRCQYDASRTGGLRGPQYPQRPLTSGNDQLVGIIRLYDGNRRRDVMNLRTPVHRRGPAVVRQ